MKNTKEVKAILTAIHCINYVSDSRDQDIWNLTNYAFRRLFGANTNLITLACVGRTKAELMPEIMQVLEEDTQYRQYLEEIKEKK